MRGLNFADVSGAPSRARGSGSCSTSSGAGLRIASSHRCRYMSFCRAACPPPLKAPALACSQRAFKLRGIILRTCELGALYLHRWE